MTDRPVTAQTRVRAWNRLTLPASAVRAMGIVVGDRIVVEVDALDHDHIRLRRIRGSYAGALAGVYGDVEESVDIERTSWR